MDPIRITEGVHWIGAQDPNRTVFDVIMPIDHGTSYNAFLVRGRDKIAVIETNKNLPDMQGQFLEHLRSLVDPARIDYIILDHLEPDHSGALGNLLEIAPQARVVVSRSGEHFVKHILNRDVQPLRVTDGDSLDLGGKTLRFAAAPFLHWPDTMFTYLVEDRILFSGDFLGSHYADERLFNDLMGDFTYYFRYYYDVIMRPFKDYVLKALDKIKDWPVDLICPAHGPDSAHKPQLLHAKVTPPGAARRPTPLSRRRWCSTPAPTATRGAWPRLSPKGWFRVTCRLRSWT